MSGVFANSTIRQTLRVTLGASKIRLRISNAFGDENLVIASAAIGLPMKDELGASILQPNSSRMIAFSGNQEIFVPNGALVVSDPVNLQVNAQSTLLIDLYLANGLPGGLNGHPGSRTTSWLSLGNQVGKSNFTDPSTVRINQWLAFLSW
jgi:hypothetical protein